MKNKETKKEKLIVTISTIVLILLVVGTAFAYYYANFIGTRENNIISGKLEINFDNESAMTLTNQKPVSDEVGTSITDDKAYTFDVNSTINSDTQINYDLAFDLISNEGITNDNVKINLLKKYVLDGVAKEEYVIGTATTGELVSNLQARTSNNKYFNEYVLDSGFFTKTGTVSYVLKAWVTGSDEEIKLNISNTDNVCSNTTYTTKDTCEANGGVWGSSHKAESLSNSSYQFKVKLKGEQVEN
jgi:hypothetical protein